LRSDKPAWEGNFKSGSCMKSNLYAISFIPDFAGRSVTALYSFGTGTAVWVDVKFLWFSGPHV
jgi:hypothetical protein